MHGIRSACNEHAKQKSGILLQTRRSATGDVEKAVHVGQRTPKSRRSACFSAVEKNLRQKIEKLDKTGKEIRLLWLASERDGILARAKGFCLPRVGEKSGRKVHF